MAGDWIPMRLDLADDPAVIVVSEATGIDIDAVVGKLHRLWSWANRQSRDGHASVTLMFVDRHVGVTGFAQSLISAGWLEETKNGIRFPNFDNWNSQGAKRRILAAKRQSRKRHASVTPPAQRKRDQRREEKRVNTPIPPDVGFAEFWAAYPRKDAKPKALKSWRKLDPDEATRARIMADVTRRAAGEKWQENGGEFIPHPATYLNQRRWEDEGVVRNGTTHDDELARRYAGPPADDDL